MGPGSTYCPQWLRGADTLFETLVRDVVWRAEQRVMYERVVAVPRLLAFFGRHAPLPHPALEAARTELGAHYAAELGEPFTTAGLCFYRDGQDGVAWHGDTVGRGGSEDTMVAILSLGAPRQLALRPRRPGPAPVPQAARPRRPDQSWAAAVSAPGSARSPRPRGPSGHASACSSGPTGVR
ncbi:hypothetical protein SBADM41S_00780 [Streptomyces badius]